VKGNPIAMKKPILYDYFDNEAKKLLSEYNTTKLLKSSQNMGKNRENFLNDFLKVCLPNRLSVKEGEIWDNKGYKTGQIDTIITRDDCPSLRFGGKNEHINAYLAEGIFAVIEVKTKLSKVKLIEAGKKLEEVRALNVDFGVTMRSGPACERPLRLVFAYEGATWKTIEDEIKKRKWETLFDIICILKQGALISAFEDNKIYRLFGDTEEGECFLIASGKASALGFLYYFLVSYGVSFLARSININQYFEPISFWSNEK